MLGYTTEASEQGGHSHSHQPPEKMWVTPKPLKYASDPLDSVAANPAGTAQNWRN